MLAQHQLSWNANLRSGAISVWNQFVLHALRKDLKLRPIEYAVGVSHNRAAICEEYQVGDEERINYDCIYQHRIKQKAQDVFKDVEALYFFFLAHPLQLVVVEER